MMPFLGELRTSGLVVECRAGGLARAAGEPEPSARSGELAMARWKSLVDRVAVDPDRPLAVLFFGEANLIAGYRLYYMLRYAAHAGLRNVTLVTDGRFWIEEASTWLLESGATRVAIVEGDTAGMLDSRVAELADARTRAGVTVPETVRITPGALRGARAIDWHGDERYC